MRAQDNCWLYMITPSTRPKPSWRQGTSIQKSSIFIEHLWWQAPRLPKRIPVFKEHIHSTSSWQYHFKCFGQRWEGVGDHKHRHQIWWWWWWCVCVVRERQAFIFCYLLPLILFLLISPQFCNWIEQIKYLKFCNWKSKTFFFWFFPICINKKCNYQGEHLINMKTPRQPLWIHLIPTISPDNLPDHG